MLTDNKFTGVGLRGFTNSDLLANHKTVMSELVARDKNRASVVMWSVANEPQSEVIINHVM